MSAIDTPETPAPAGDLYRAFWRWHFYAGLLVLSVLMLMALTGGLYLFKDELSAIVQRPPPSGVAVAATTRGGSASTAPAVRRQPRVGMTALRIMRAILP